VHLFSSRKFLFWVAKKQTETLKITLESIALGVQQKLNTPTCDVPPREPRTQNKNTFFDLNMKTFWIRIGFEQLSSSGGWRVIGLQSFAKKWHTRDLKGSKQQTVAMEFLSAARKFFLKP